MTRRACIVLAAIAIGLTVSCATTTQQGSPGSSRNVLTEEDLQDQPDRNLYELLSRMRPNWIRPRGAVLASGTTPVVVYVDNVRIGGVDVLTDMTLDQVIRVRFVDANDAATRYGMNTDGGVLEVTTRRR